MRSQRLVALLALRGPQSRTLASMALWPGVDEAHARTSARATLWTLANQAPGLVEAVAGDVQVARDVHVDVHRFLALTRSILDGDARMSAAPPGTLAAGSGGRRIPSPPGTAERVDLSDMLGGDLLPSWQDDWIVLERERLRQLRLHVLEQLAADLVAQRRFAEALQVALDAVAIDPLRESAHRMVVRIHLSEGNVAEALRRYERFRLLLKEALGIEPSRQMTELVEWVYHSRRRSRQAPSAPSVAGLASVPVSLPRPQPGGETPWRKAGP
jgi:DNA-binding SARP family transcriptional activator